MHRGYVRLFRKSLESPIFSNPDLWRFFEYCLLKATHTQTTVLVGYQFVELGPGQFVFGRTRAAAETGLSEATIKSCIKALKKNGSITIQPTNKYSIITIVNWTQYQADWKGSGQRVAPQPTTNHPASHHIQSHKPHLSHQSGEYTSEFLEFYEKYPIKKGKKAALRAYLEASKDVSHSKIMTGVEKLLQAISSGIQDAAYTKHPATWLNKACWDDEYKRIPKGEKNEKHTKRCRGLNDSSDYADM